MGLKDLSSSLANAHQATVPATRISPTASITPSTHRKQNRENANLVSNANLGGPHLQHSGLSGAFPRLPLHGSSGDVTSPLDFQAKPDGQKALHLPAAVSVPAASAYVWNGVVGTMFADTCETRSAARPIQDRHHRRAISGSMMQIRMACGFPATNFDATWQSVMASEMARLKQQITRAYTSERASSTEPITLRSVRTFADDSA
mmetsp:Transcript_38547/g.103314  ORF Transcript_38547/g.103314 Transcript_38547/m.103314 type:complete len:204 (+) Transcript_38547:652-1263(+)